MKNRLAKYWTQNELLVGFTLNPFAPWLMPWQTMIYQAAFQQALQTVEEDTEDIGEWCI